MAETEQNKTEEATPFKLKRAREKGTLARSAELGFFSCLVAFGLFFLAAAPHAFQALTLSMRQTLLAIQDARDAPLALANAVSAYSPALQSVALLAATVVTIVVFFEIVQVRGIVFSATPLKPDFGRINPAKGLKRLFSVRMLKETLKNIVKLVAYTAVAYLVVRHGFETSGRTITGAPALVEVLRADGARLLSGFALLALFFAGLDQVLVRGEFAKQMRMSRGEFTREIREREGEPRLKQKRRQLHAEFSKQTRGIGNLAGADLVIVNPEHYAVALRYDANHMAAPVLRSKGRNHFALRLKQRARELSIPIFESPALARALYRACNTGDEIAPACYRPVADLYLKLMRDQSKRSLDAVS